MQYNLLDFLSGFTDPRRPQGQRHPLPVFLLMIVMAIISGEQGLKGFARFMRSNEEELTATFGLKHGVPKFNTTRTLLQSIQVEELAARFGQWMRQHFPPNHEVWLAMDGKALRSTVSNAQGSLQSFVYVVSVFAQHSGLVQSVSSFESGKAYEAAAVRDLIQKLGFKDAVFTLDALHCQKKRLTSS